MRHWIWIALAGTAMGHAGLAMAAGNLDVTKCGMALLQADYDAALPSCDRALQSGDLSDSQRADVLNNRGAAYVGKGDYDRAIQDFNQAIRLNPDNDNPYINRASAYANQGKYDQAIEGFDQAIRLDPSYTFTSLLKGQVLFELARFSDAADAIETFVDDRPELPEGSLWLTLARRRGGDGVGDTLGSQAKQLNLKIWPGPV